MLLLFACLCVFASATATERTIYDLSKAEEYFRDFIQTYQKNYDASERLQRFATFTDNLRTINRLNSFNESIFGINMFADVGGGQLSCLSPDDGTQQRTCVRLTDAQITGVSAPQSLDLRKSDFVTSVKHQGKCNSCWAFVTVGILEGANKKKNGVLLTLSPKQLMDCSGGKTCESRGSMWKAFSYLMGTKGIMLEQDYPYVDETTPCKYNQAKAKVRVKTCNYYELKNEEKLKEALVKYGPIGISLDGSSLLYYKSGIIDLSTCPSPPNNVNHSMLLVGYGTENGKDYWLLKNSYGPNWGERGYVRIARGRNVCGLNNAAASSATVY